MAKTKTKAKSKSNFDFKKMLLAKGEYFLLGAAALFTLIMVFSGFSSWSAVTDPADKIKELTTKAEAVNVGIKSTNIPPDDLKATEVPEWAKKDIKYAPVAITDFPVSGPPFELVGKPGTKRDNPRVIEIGNLKYQVDLIRAPMLAFDIQGTGDSAKIAVHTEKATGPNQKNFGNLAPQIEKRQKRADDAMKRMMGQGPGGPAVPGGTRPGMAPPPGIGGGRAGQLQTQGLNQFGDPAGRFDTNAQRTERTIKYVPLTELDQSIKAGNLPATTVVPLRMVVIHAEIPFKKQLEEVKRACRLKTLEEARTIFLNGGGYDGFDVKRQITRLRADGKEDMISEMAEYKYEDPYVERIASRSLADNFEDGYMSYFIPYDMFMALPLPQLVSGLGTYPKIRLEGINKTIEALQNAEKKPVEHSALMIKLTGRGERGDLYRPKTSADTGAKDLPGWNDRLPQFEAPKRPMGGGAVTPKMANDAAIAATAPPIEIENLLLRFIDADIKPGLTYRYEIRLRMKNPNFGLTKEVANPKDAGTAELFSWYTAIADPIDVPLEDFLYAGNVSDYRKRIDDEFKDQRELRPMLQVKDNQVVVEMCKWMDQVKLDTGGKGEPVGTWVVADMPVGRGEYIGRKQYVKLPLWSSVAKDFVLREVPDSIPGVTTKPKGWLVNFSTRALLVDFEGGKVVTKIGGVGGKTATEDVATEMLIVRPDGKLMVKSSLVDQADSEENTDHKNIVKDWHQWIKDVENRKSPDAKDGGFERIK